MHRKPAFLYSVLLLVSVFFISHLFCAPPQKKREIQRFDPIPVNLERLEQGDFSEIDSIINNRYGESTHIFGGTMVTKDEGAYLYLHTFSQIAEDICYRTTVNKVRSKIVSIQPDCPWNSYANAYLVYQSVHILFR
jgi:hypothetical protein